MRTLFWHSTIIEIRPDFTFLLVFRYFKLFIIKFFSNTSTNTNADFIQDYIFLAIHHLLSKKTYLVSSKLFLYLLTC